MSSSDAAASSSSSLDMENHPKSKSLEEREKDDALWLKKKLQKNEVARLTSAVYHVLRLAPGEDLLESLWRYARVQGIKAATIVSAVGSLQRTNIRYSNQTVGTVVEDRFEIVSLTGNIDHQSRGSLDYPSSMGPKEGSAHVHISISDKHGLTLGGHLLVGNIVYTTAEITLVEFTEAEFGRQFDSVEEGGSGYYELSVTPLK